MTRWREPLSVLLWGVLGLGCFGGWGGGGGGCNDDSPPARSCDGELTGAALDGKWELHGSGRRSDCRERRLEGALELDTTVPLVVEAQAQATFGDAGGPLVGNESDAFVQRIERADFVLDGDERAGKVELSGYVRGSCVNFTLLERLPDGDALRYELSGELVDVGVVRGTFTGTGPERCRMSGSFTARIR